jgi:4a-hydroxytetrahydrobiopterin dehydratase
MSTAADKQKLSAEEIADRLPHDFRHLPGQLMARYRLGNFAAAQALAATIGTLAEEANHHPDLLVGWGYLEARLSSHDVGGITPRDLALAAQISAAAATAGAHPEPTALQVVDWGLDTWADDEVLPFWRAILGYGDAHRNDELADPSSRGGPTLWFQGTDEHETPRQRFHPDIWVPVDEARPRIAAALAAGGSLVSDDEAPSFWVLSDPQGNRVCICTVEERAT